MIAVCRGGRPGYVDLSGVEVIPAGCRIAGEIRGNFVRPSGKYVGAICGGHEALFDPSGKMILPPKYERVIPKEIFATVSDGDRWGVVGLPDGSIIIPLVYDSISPAFNEKMYSIARYGGTKALSYISTENFLNYQKNRQPFCQNTTQYYVDVSLGVLR